jgi:DNA gyrase inhibitor GyrI
LSASSSLRAPNIAPASRSGWDDDPVKWGLETGTIPGGLCLRVRLRGEPPEIYEQIGPRMAELEASTDRDENRPLIEFYRRRDAIDLLVPARS